MSLIFLLHACRPSIPHCMQTFAVVAGGRPNRTNNIRQLRALTAHPTGIHQHFDSFCSLVPCCPPALQLFARDFHRACERHSCPPTAGVDGDTDADGHIASALLTSFKGECLILNMLGVGRVIRQSLREQRQPTRCCSRRRLAHPQIQSSFSRHATWSGITVVDGVVSRQQQRCHVA